jgi:sporulation protein YlmC with PRC-barrel domain
MMRLSEFIGKKLVTDDNKTLGYIFDLVSGGRPIDGRPDTETAMVFEIEYGSHNVLERIELITPKRSRIGWDQVIEIQKDKVIVRGKK